MAAAVAAALARRLGALDWDAVARALRDQGHATTRPLLTGAECASLAALYHHDRRFRARVDMTRFRFGRGVPPGEQRPRAQSRGWAIALEQGAAVIFPTLHRPLAGTRGVSRATVRHGLSPVRTGERLALGIIFHDAE
jgi:hypothetical protein